MQLKTLYALVGLAWGLVLGAAAGIGTGAVAAGVSWLFLFGDNPWPETAGQGIILVASAAGLAVFGFCLWAGYAIGGRLDQSSAIDVRSARWKGYGAGAVAVVLAVVAVGLGAAGQSHEKQRRQVVESKEISFAGLVQARHKIVAVDVAASDATGEITVTVSTLGSRPGQYKLKWAVREQAFKNVLLSGTEVAPLEDGAQDISFSFAAAQLQSEYKQVVLKNRGGVLVEEDFLMVATLWPILTEKEFQALPRRQRQNLILGESPLFHARSVAFPVRFTIR